MIHPPFTLYSLRVEPGVMNSPPVPAVRLVQESVESGRDHIATHTITPDQARDLATGLATAANEADGRRPAGPARGPSAVIRAEAAVAKLVAVSEGSEHAAGRAAGLARAVTITERSGRHVSPAVREHLVEQVVETAQHLRALSLNGVEFESDIYLDTLARLGDVTQRLADFDAAAREVSA